MRLALKVYPRRYVPLYHRDLLGADAMFRLRQNQLSKLITTLKRVRRIMFTGRALNLRKLQRINKIIRVLRIRRAMNMIVEMPERKKSVAFERQTFHSFIEKFCCFGMGYLSLPISSFLRFRTEIDLHRLIFISFLSLCLTLVLFLCVVD